MGKNNVLIYTEWLEDLEDIGNEESGILFQNILRYQSGNTDLLPMDKVTNAIFRNIKRCIDRDNKAYEAKCEKNKQISKEYWEKRKQETNRTDSNDTERIRTISDNDNDKDKENDKENDKDKDKENDNDVRKFQPKKNKHGFTARNYDYESLEKDILGNK